MPWLFLMFAVIIYIPLVTVVNHILEDLMNLGVSVDASLALHLPECPFKEQQTPKADRNRNK